LLKPTGQVPHQGGLRLRVEDAEYDLLRRWIASGCPADAPGTPTCSRIEVYPAQRTLHAPQREQQLCVLAHFSDGSVRDVTDLADFSSTAEKVAGVTPSGLIQ